jgi:hypothetical protein
LYTQGYFTPVSNQGGVKLPPMCISASRLARIKIPTATPMFLGSNFSMVPSVILPEETGCQKTKMAAAETGSIYNSASRLDRNAILAATPMFSGSSNSMGLLRTLPDTSGSRKSKMAATETGSTYNSASRLDRNAVSTATPMFSRILGVAVGILPLIGLEADIQVFPIWRPPD